MSETAAPLLSVSSIETFYGPIQAIRGVSLDVSAGQAGICKAGEWVKYSSPNPEGAEYIAICLPAFSPQTVHRDA